MPANPLATYRDNAILSASPAQLLTMFYDRLLLDLTFGREALLTDDSAEAMNRIAHAGEIIATLAGSLRTDVWDGADGLLSLYIYVATALVRANLTRNPGLLDECIALMQPLREAFQEASASLATRPSWQTTAEAGEESQVIAVA
ncbi:flagellar-like protein [Leifsonia xyli subsp. xyli str. CTCB07]|uniref:Flagellar-like protein n=1 Tax=Leifsonia xyli subsp. xyli (strain CTCB07) TaxID=281090 RepID=Q6AGB3_LEIXX|nr:flagellar export chaperone FliS [Leifsonia xyli]AAT88582.1 flagellar-like protein [Leifsonia xyli subsp. xyli str. CTCB07]